MKNDVKQLDISQIIAQFQYQMIVIERLPDMNLSAKKFEESFQVEIHYAQELFIEFAHRYQKILNQRKDDPL